MTRPLGRAGSAPAPLTHSQASKIEPFKTLFEAFRAVSDTTGKILEDYASGKAQP